jgi:hypothetical protein
MIVFVTVALIATPAHGQTSSDRVTLERSECFGTCPVYRVEVARDGLVTFTGKAHVLAKNGNRRLGPTAFKPLVAHLEAGGFFNLDSAYVPGRPGCIHAATDAPSATLTVIAGMRKKTVRYYYGCLGDAVNVNNHDSVMSVMRNPRGAGATVRALADYVDSVAGINEWVERLDHRRMKPVHHYVFFGGEREQIRTASSFLKSRKIEGAQIIYQWRLLEPRKDEYDFTPIRDDLAFLSSKGKKLWIQLQDVSFSESRINVPKYLLEDSAYHGGAARQYTFLGENDSSATPAGWVARRWDPAVQGRFQKLLFALGKEFDGKIAGINLPETSVDFGETGRFYPEGFSVDTYREAIPANFKALKIAFPNSVAMQYANFIPGEWRPMKDKGYLQGIYRAARSANVGVGGPDLLPYREGQLKSSYPLIRAASGFVPTGIAVQDGNLEQINPKTGRRVTVDDLLEFAMQYLRVDYIFWGTQEPYYSAEVIPLLNR